MESQQKIMFLIIIGCVTMLLMATVVVLFMVTYKRNMLLKETQIQIIESEKQLELFKASVEAEEQQKEKIARNLHDEINPLLALLKLNLSNHRLQAKKNMFDSEKLLVDVQMVDKAIDGIRTTCLDLIPTYLFEFGLVKSLEEHIRLIQQIDNMSVYFENTVPEGELDSMSKQTKLSIYRVCLEILNNLFKHSNCTNFIMNIQLKNKLLIIDITHNGKGVDNDEMEACSKTSKGIGLKSIKARVLLLDATIEYIKNTYTSSIKLSIPNLIQ